MDNLHFCRAMRRSGSLADASSMHMPVKCNVNKGEQVGPSKVAWKKGRESSVLSTGTAQCAGKPRTSNKGNCLGKSDVKAGECLKEFHLSKHLSEYIS